MQKGLIICLLLIFSSLARSQDSTDYTLTNINRYAMNIEESLFIISGNLKADKQEPLPYWAEAIRAYTDSIDTEMEYLPDEYFYRLSPVMNVYHADINAFQKAATEEPVDEDELLTKTFNRLQQRQAELRKILSAAYGDVLQQPSTREVKISNESVEIKPQAETEMATPVSDSHVVFTETSSNANLAASNNPALLTKIQASQKQIVTAIDSLHASLKRNKFTKVSVYAKSISNASLTISDLCLLLQTSGKENLFILANGLKTLSQSLQETARKGASVSDKIHELVNEIEIKFSTLSTGIGLVQ